MSLIHDPKIYTAAQNLITIYEDPASTPQMRNLARMNMSLWLELAEAEQAQKLKEGVL